MKPEQHIHSEFEIGLYDQGVLQTFDYRMIMSYPVQIIQNATEWVHQYTNKVPARWQIWHKMESDFQNAGKNSVQLSPTLVQAGLDHYDFRIVCTVATNQRLTVEQLAYLLVSDSYLSNIDKLQILHSQESMGVSSHEAFKLARKLRFGFELK